MKDIKGFEKEYAITEDGKVWSYKSKKFLAPHIVNSGYYQIRLCKDGIYHRYYLHRLVCEAYIPNPDNLPEVNHKDENKTNNHMDNLEWCTHSYNNNYGTHSKRAGEKHRRPVYCIELDKAFTSMRIAADELNLNYQILSFVLSGKYRNKTCGGYHWQYLKEA